MRKILVVVVIASAACLEPLEPAPQTPVSTVTVEQVTPPPEHTTPSPEHTTPSPVGRLKVGKAQGTDPLSDLERTYGPVIATGTEAGRPWSLRGSIGARGATTWWQTSTGGGGGGGGALPFQDLGWKKLGHFGSVGSGEHHGIGDPGTLTVEGVVSKQTAAIEVRLADGTSLPAQIIDTGDARASFFVAVWSTPSRWEVLIARDAAGTELETYRRR
jgi:hypothetical protein